eukprot:1177565-Prorocentrum_minimum.AAC.1
MCFGVAGFPTAAAGVGGAEFTAARNSPATEPAREGICRSSLDARKPQNPTNSEEHQRTTCKGGGSAAWPFGKERSRSGTVQCRKTP